VQRRLADEGWTEAWANQYRTDQDPEYAEALRFLDESARAVVAAGRAKTLRRALGALAVVLAVATAVVGYRLIQAQRLAADLAEESRVAAQAAQAANDQVARLEKLRDEAARGLTTAGAGAEQAKAQLDQLTRDIELARQQAKGSQDELSKARKDQELQRLDRSGLLKQIDAVTQERDRLRQQVNANSVQQAQPKGGASTAYDERATALQKQLDDERKTSATQAEEITRLRNENMTLRNATKGAVQRAVPTVQELTKDYTDGVRAFELKDYKRAAVSLTFAAAQQALIRADSNQELPDQVRLSGTRFVPYAPYSYLAVALYEAKQGCPSVAPHLKSAAAESVPPEIRSRLDAVRKACP
jgi:chromosome segregation ATPase